MCEPGSVKKGTQLYSESFFYIQRQIAHTTLARTNHYASLTVQHLQRSHGRYSPLRVDKGSASEAFGTGYWDDQDHPNKSRQVMLSHFFSKVVTKIAFYGILINVSKHFSLIRILMFMLA